MNAGAQPNSPSLDMSVILMLATLFLFIIAIFLPMNISPLFAMVFLSLTFIYREKFSVNINFKTAILCMAISTLYFIPNIFYSTLLPIDGTSNHDKLWYVINGKYFLNHSLLAPWEESPYFSVNYSAPRNIEIVTRYGTGVLLAAISGLTFGMLDVAHCLIILEYISVFGILYTAMQITHSKPDLAAAIFLFSPSLLAVLYNGNVATLVGLWVMSSFLMQLFLLFGDRSTVNPNFLIWKIILLTSITLFVYLEFVFIQFITVVLLIFLRPKKFLYIFGFHWRAASIGLVFMLTISSPILFKIEKILEIRSSATNDILSVPSYWEGFSYLKTLSMIFLGENRVVEVEHIVFVLLFIFCLQMVFLEKIYRRFFIAATAAMLVPLIFSVVKQYPYGIHKSVQYILPITLMFTCLLGKVLRSSVKNIVQNFRFFSQDALRSISILVFAILMISSWFQSQVTYASVGAVKRVLPEMLEMEVIEEDDILSGAFFTFDRSIQSFHEARWLGYVLDDLQTRQPETVQHGGYLFPAPPIDPDQRIFTVGKISSRQRLIEGLNLFDPVYENEKYYVIAYSGVVLSGFYDSELWGTWMGADAVISFPPLGCDILVTVPILRSYGPQRRLLVDGREVFAETLPQNLIFTLPAGTEKIEFVSEEGSFKPEDLTGSLDARDLSFGLGLIKFEQCGN